MENIDTIFKEHLQSEQRFDGRADSWAQLDRHLGAFDAGKTAKLRGTDRVFRALRVWQLAAAASIAGMAFFAYQNWETARENRRMASELAVIDEARREAELAQLNPANPGQSQGPSIETSEPLSQKSGAATADISEKTTGSTASSSEKTGGDKAVFSQKNQSSQFWKKENGLPIVSKNNSEQANYFDKKYFQEKNNGGRDNPPSSGHTAGSPGDALAEAALLKAENARLAEKITMLEQALALENRLDSVDGFLPVERLRPAPVAAQAGRKTTIELAPAPPVDAPIRPVAKKLPRLRLGVQAVASQDLKNTDNKSWETGQGLAAELRVAKGLSIAAMADWGTYSFESEKTPRHIRPVDTTGFNDHHGGGHGGGPGGGKKPRYELKKVAGSQREQNYSVGINYVLPVGFAVKPVVRLGHTWTRRSEVVTSSTFEDKPDPGDPGGDPFDPVVVAETTPSSWASNRWRAGLGLDYQLGRWTLGAAADWHRDMGSSNPEPDALTLRAGVSYNF